MCLSLGVKFAPRGELYPLFTTSFTLRGEHSPMFRRMEGRTEDLHSYIEDNLTSAGQSLPLGGEIKNRPRVVKKHSPEAGNIGVGNNSWE
jgi:hypothetical protein